MTQEEFINCELAQMLFDWKWHLSPHSEFLHVWTAPEMGTTWTHTPPRFCSDWEACGRLLERIQEKGWHVSIISAGASWEVEIEPEVPAVVENIGKKFVVRGKNFCSQVALAVSIALGDVSKECSAFHWAEIK